MASTVVAVPSPPPPAVIIKKKPKKRLLAAPAAVEAAVFIPVLPAVAEEEEEKKKTPPTKKKKKPPEEVRSLIKRNDVPSDAPTTTNSESWVCEPIRRTFCCANPANACRPFGLCGSAAFAMKCDTCVCAFRLLLAAYVFFTALIFILVGVGWFTIHFGVDDPEIAVCVRYINDDPLTRYIEFRHWDTGRMEYRTFGDTDGKLDVASRIYFNSTQNITAELYPPIVTSANHYTWRVDQFAEGMSPCSDGVKFVVLSKQLNTSELDFGIPLAVYSPTS